METRKFLKLNDIEAFRISFHLSNYVWDVVLKWSNFSQRTVGEQFVRAVDSISANVAEGFGRYSKKDKIKFYRYSQGSLSESLNWNEKSKFRKLLSKEEYNFIFAELQKLPKAINSLILFTNEKLKV
ncbi:MAG TPA: four helix bundle protein [Chitinophagaceae bacterium]|nr:four helix bundle protein [Chitinophagaceae bacterium]